MASLLSKEDHSLLDGLVLFIGLILLSRQMENRSEEDIERIVSKATSQETQEKLQALLQNEDIRASTENLLENEQVRQVLADLFGIAA